MNFVSILFWVCFSAVVYTYVLYPFLLRMLASFKKPDETVFSRNDDLPAVSILIAAYNEEQVIAAKLDSILNSNYPPDKLEILIGSDHSTDRTDSIISRYSEKDSRFKLFSFSSRTGKTGIINELVKKARYDLLILTDANVIFDVNTVFELIRHYKNADVALVDSRMVNTGIKKDGISLQEKSYIKTEVYIKNYEGVLWGTMMGPFGGCYSLRKNFYHPVPANFLVDDFYINMKVLQQGGKCINEINAIAYEDVSNNPSVEYNRKVRIAAGSFQNLFHFLPVILKFNAISFCFVSHKVMRWKGPFYMITFYICSFFLMSIPFYKIVMLISTLVFLAPLPEYILRSVFKINFSPLRFLSHFTTTNAAQVAGFLRYLGGIKSGIWQPTERNQ